jgi:hypothetical protein
MGWIAEHLNKESRNKESRNNDPRQNHQGADAPANQFMAQARRRWLQLAEELRADVGEFNSHGSGAGFAQPTDDRFEITNSASGLQLVIDADFGDQIIRYEYSSVNDNSAGTPEGGILSMRQSQRGNVEFYSADERLTSEETREILLKPVLFPPSKPVL